MPPDPDHPTPSASSACRGPAPAACPDRRRRHPVRRGPARRGDRAGTRGPGPPSRPPAGSARWPRWILRPTVIYLVSRALTWTTLAITTLFTHQSILQEVDRWDSRWFLRAAAQGWPRHLPFHDGHVAGSTIAFFPLFPLSIRWLSHLTGLSLLAAGHHHHHGDRAAPP